MKRKDTNFVPSPHPSPQGEGTSGNPTASGWGIKNIINIEEKQGLVQLDVKNEISCQIRPFLRLLGADIMAMNKDGY